MELPIGLIYCAAGNSRFAKIAIDAGFLYGAQLPNKIYHPIYFADQNWKKPNRESYLQQLELHRPKMATVLDLESYGQLSEVLSWADDVSKFVETVIIIPKVNGIIKELPLEINSKKIRLGYSVPTKYAGATVPLGEFEDHDVHLLGGSPHAQMNLMNSLNVKSADGNYAQKMALQFCSFWQSKTYSTRFWTRTDQLFESPIKQDCPYIAFELSCHNIMQAWKELYGTSS